MSPKSYRRAEVAAVLVPALGEPASKKLIEETAKHLGLERDDLSFEEVMAILEHIASAPGIVGIAARFSKTRVILMWGSGRS